MRRPAFYIALAVVVIGVYLVLARSLLRGRDRRRRRRRRRVATSVVAVARPSAPAASPEPEDGLPDWVGHLRDLAKLDSVIREHACPEPVVAKLEENIDVLRRLLPELNEGYVGSELTWTVNRMATDYLSRIVRPYVELSATGRVEHQEELLAEPGGAGGRAREHRRAGAQREGGGFQGEGRLPARALPRGQALRQVRKVGGPGSCAGPCTVWS